MSPSQFLTICLGGIVCLTPLAVYLFWLTTLNRRHHPTVVAASWEFAGLLAGLSGLLFCIGVLLSAFVVDRLLFSQSVLAMKVSEATLLWIGWGVPMALYLLLLARAIRRSLAARRNTLAVFNVDADMLAAAIDEALILANCPAARQGNSWLLNGRSVIEVAIFPAFQHAALRLTGEPTFCQTLERLLRTEVPRLPAAAENPAVTWISAATTCSIVFVGCCVVIVFAMPFLR